MNTKSYEIQPSSFQPHSKRPRPRNEGAAIIGPYSMYDTPVSSNLPHEQPTPTWVKVAAGVALAGAALGALKLMSGGSDGIKRWGEADTAITSVELEDDARLRNDPYVGSVDLSNNLIHEVAVDDDTHVSVQTPDGIYITNNDNGEWRGLSVEDLAASGIKITGDKDGIVWVNHQKSRVTTAEEND